MNLRIVVVIGGLALLIGGLLIAYWPLAPVAPSSDVHTDTPAPRSRVAIPRPLPAAAPPEGLDTDIPKNIDTDAIRAEVDTDQTTSRSTVPAMQGATGDLQTDLRHAMQDVGDELVQCLGTWNDLPNQASEGRVTFAFRLDDTGMAEMEVLDVDHVPEATLACLGDVLWDEAHWPVVEEELEVTWPIQLTVDE